MRHGMSSLRKSRSAIRPEHGLCRPCGTRAQEVVAAISQLIAGPTQAEKTQGYYTPLQGALSGASTGNRADVTITLNSNRGHAETIFRVRVDGLTPQTTYYYAVTSMGGNGQSDGVQSPVNQFTTAAPGEQIRAYPQPK